MNDGRWEVRWKVMMVAAGLVVSGAAAQESASEAESEHSAGHEVRRPASMEKWLVKQQDVRARKAKLENELAGLDREAPEEGHWAREWAGVYETSSRYGYVIGLAPDAGVLCYELHGFDAAFASGTIEEVFEDGVRVRWEVMPEDEGRMRVESRLYFVRCGGYRLAVPDLEMRRLVDQLNERGTRDIRRLFVPKRYDWKGLVTPWPPEMPKLPEPWDGMLLREPVRLTVKSVSETPNSDGEWLVELVESEEGGGAYAGLTVTSARGREQGKVRLVDKEEGVWRGWYGPYWGGGGEVPPGFGEGWVFVAPEEGE